MTMTTHLSLKDLIEQKIIQKTDATRKLTIQGITKNYKVYRIPTKYLHYNNQNGRIISSINRYESEGKKLDLSDKESYNNILQQYIIDSNSTALQATKSNIKLFGQRLPGVVLNDGKVIDGNRRFTCVRLINAEDGTNLYFEAVILDQAEGLTDTDIKRLELNLQHAEERPVDYDPIDNLVEVYTVIVKDKLFSVEDYAHNTNKTKSEVEKMVKKATLMVEFLEFINAEGKYYVARDLNLDLPVTRDYGDSK
ncbi:ParB/Sulfiredoxin domain-containing protein OS=Lysinibacillus sphaericus OX=1421 GN=LS41612_04835 PE=4 SV=1 [Lysinibacillus sphaericus]